MGEFIAVFIIGGVYSVVLVATGFIIAHYAPKQRLLEIKQGIAEKIHSRLAGKSNTEGGPIKAITRAEREAEKNKGFSDKLKEYLPNEN